LFINSGKRAIVAGVTGASNLTTPASMEIDAVTSLAQSQILIDPLSLVLSHLALCATKLFRNFL